MRLTLTLALSLLMALTTAATTAQVAERPSVRPRDDQTPATPLLDRLDRRQCNYNGCRCNSRGNQMTVCGACVWLDDGSWVVTEKRVLEHIFECSPTGDCCSYGYATDCNTGGGRCRIY